MKYIKNFGLVVKDRDTAITGFGGLCYMYKIKVINLNNNFDITIAFSTSEDDYINGIDYLGGDDLVYAFYEFLVCAEYGSLTFKEFVDKVPMDYSDMVEAKKLHTMYCEHFNLCKKLGLDNQNITNLIDELTI